MDFRKIYENIREWCKDMNRKRSNSVVDNELLSKTLHIVFEKIHPWMDGNGRTGRIFMNWHRIKILGLPLKTIKYEDRFDYYKWFA